jgi:hypothetical protein
MSQVDQDSVSNPRWTVWLIGGGAVLLLALLAWAVLGPTGRKLPRSTQDPGNAENALDVAVQTLARESDLNTCRAALQQVNTHLNQTGSERLPGMTPEERKRLEPLRLDPRSLAELESVSCTLLDGQYLEQCLLLRDAAGLLQPGVPVKGPDGKPVRPTALDRAAAAFAWVMRQVRLEDKDPGTAPPAYVLRRGWGSGLERGLVFLALLRQAGAPGDLQGCLVFHKGKDDSAPRFWACGVLAGAADEIFLFDPRLGLALPGPDGQGIATLAQVRKDPAVLAQLSVSDQARYDIAVSADASEELALDYPLSGLAPRMRFLQDKVLRKASGVELVCDPSAEWDRWKSAGDKLAGVRTRWWGGPRSDRLGLWPGQDLLQGFLPAEEGGIDSAGRLRQFQLQLVPWNAMPADLREVRQSFRGVALAQIIDNAFEGQFVQTVTDPQQPRTLVLRGQFSRAAPMLVRDQDRYQQMIKQVRQNLKSPTAAKEFDDWVKDMRDLYAKQANPRTTPEEREEVNQQIPKKWREATVVSLKISEATTPYLLADLGYLLALCKHDEAALVQARLDLVRRAGIKPTEDDLGEAQRAWENAAYGWRAVLEYHDEFPGAPGADAAHRWRGQALAQLDRQDEAAREWEVPAASVQPLEKVAGLYLAKQLRKAHNKK